MKYEAPTMSRVGSVHELTLSNINKTSGSGDVIVIAGQPIPVPGRGVISVS